MTAGTEITMMDQSFLDDIINIIRDDLLFDDWTLQVDNDSSATASLYSYTAFTFAWSKNMSPYDSRDDESIHTPLHDWNWKVIPI